MRKHPRPQESDQVAPVDEARGDEKAAGDEEDVDRHLGQRQAEMVEKEFTSRGKPEHPDAMAEEDRERRQKADQVEIVVAADGVVGQSHLTQLAARRVGLKVFSQNRPTRWSAWPGKRAGGLLLSHAQYA